MDMFCPIRFNVTVSRLEKCGFGNLEEFKDEFVLKWDDWTNCGLCDKCGALYTHTLYLLLKKIVEG